MIRAPQAGKIFSDLANLLGGPKSVTGIAPDDGIVEDFNVQRFLPEGGCANLIKSGEESKICVCIVIPDGFSKAYEYCLMSRKRGEFSEFEAKLCDEIAKGATVLWKPFTDPDYAYPAHARAAIFQTAILLGISRFLRSDPYNFWGIAQIIMATQNLTFKSYEGKPCTSGFICLQSSFKEATNQSSQEANWEIKSLAPPVVIDHLFFSEVGSYRYVDGSNNLYLASVQRKVPLVIGSVSLKSQTRFSLSEKVLHQHLRALVNSKNTFAVTANRNSEVEVVPLRDQSKDFLCWTRGAWRLANMGLIGSLLERSIDDPVTVNILVEAVRTLSLLRYGTLILIPDRETNLPPVAGMIDRSALGDNLRGQIKGKRIRELVEGGRFLNILSSDGTTVISRKGKIIETGAIISNREMDPAQGAGGARTAAAKAASRYGIAIKVSADGPVSVFMQDELIYSTL